MANVNKDGFLKSLVEAIGVGNAAIIFETYTVRASFAEKRDLADRLRESGISFQVAIPEAPKIAEVKANKELEDDLKLHDELTKQ